MKNLKLISFVIPVFNEEETINNCYDVLISFAKRHSTRYNFEFIFTDNHSSDKTYELLTSITQHDSRFAIFRFSRNFGYQNSIQFGIKQTQGDAVVQFDSDLQDPIELVERFIELWENGFQVVYGIRKSRKEGVFITSARRLYYRILNSLSEYDIPVDAGDFRLCDKVIVNQLKNYEDYDPYIRGFIAYLGYKSIGVPYKRMKREHGKSKFKFFDLLALALRGLVNGTLLPLRLLSVFGLFLSLGCMFWGFSIVFSKVFFSADWPSGFATLALLLISSIGLNSLFFGVIGEYIANIQRHSQKRPTVALQAIVDRRKKS
jgi:polyisoprenyl-phosphate glycosyltransferase